MIFESDIWLSLVILIPVFAVIVTFSVPRYAVQLGMVGAVLTFVSAFAAAFAIIDGGAARATLGGWGAPLGIDLVGDGLAVIMLMMTAVVGLAISIYGAGYFDDPDPHKRSFFWPLWMFLWGALNALFLSGDIFNLYVTLELVGLSAVALTALVGKPAAVRAAMRYLLVSLTGSLFYLMGVALLYGGFGLLDIGQIGMVTELNTPLFAAAALMTTGLMMKTALFPLHFWLPPAHANAAAPVSALLSALVVKGSFYMLLRLWIEIFYPLGDTPVPYALSALGAGAIIWGSIQALRQPRFKLLVAYSTVAQLGYLFLVIPLLVVSGEDSRTALGGIVYFMLAHAMAKSAAFLSAGNILHATGDDSIASLDGIMRAMPVTVTAFALAGISLVALPPSGGFIAKWLLLDAAISGGHWLLVVIIISGGLMAAGYVMRVLGRTFRDVEEGAVVLVHPVSPLMGMAALGLALVALALGFSGIYLLDILDIVFGAVAGGAA